MYELVEPERNYVFESMITVDGQFIIFQDNVFDVKNNTSLGNIWESIDRFKSILQNVKYNNTEFQQIQESIGKLPILEGINDLYSLRDYLIENKFFDNTWVGRQLKSAGHGISDFAKTSWEGVKDMGVAISKGDWEEIWSLIGKGIVYVLRKLKQAMYSNIGITVDAILIAVTSGVGKIPLAAVWGLILGLDIYQLVSGDWEEGKEPPTDLAKALEIGFDILGVLTTGAFAKASRVMFKPVLKMKDAATAGKHIAKNPVMINTIKKIKSGIGKIPEKLSQVERYFSKTFPEGSKFISKSIEQFSSVSQRMSNSLDEVLKHAKVSNPEIVRKGAKTGGVVTGINYGIDKITGEKPIDNVDLQIIKNLNPDFSGVEI